MIDTSNNSRNRHRRAPRRGSTGQMNRSESSLMVDNMPTAMPTDMCVSKEPRSTKRERRVSMEHGTNNKSSTTPSGRTSKQKQGRRRSSKGHPHPSEPTTTNDTTSDRKPRRSSGRRSHSTGTSSKNNSSNNNNKSPTTKPSRRQSRRSSIASSTPTPKPAAAATLTRSQTTPALATLAATRQRRRFSGRQKQQSPPHQQNKKFVSTDSFGDNIFALDPNQVLRRQAFEFGKFENVMWEEVTVTTKPRRSNNNHMELLCNVVKEKRPSADGTNKNVKSAAIRRYKAAKAFAPSPEPLVLSREALQVSCNLRF
ncbi:expressed unknown protein [Seminavis robusta]|uniref:Uncharacterized protein n=1 Tax=Seminavis robusta TaxID=568900 RepID=A0A9N8E9T1_9STRA|nr:expressed unknown protein [Seminavis robusta]|eukprot:Sro666_g183930.1 n/a (312) ;mRNA; r:9400-10335